LKGSHKRQVKVGHKSVSVEENRKRLEGGVSRKNKGLSPWRQRSVKEAIEARGCAHFREAGETFAERDILRTTEQENERSGGREKNEVLREESALTYPPDWFRRDITES